DRNDAPARVLVGVYADRVYRRLRQLDYSASAFVPAAARLGSKPLREPFLERDDPLRLPFVVLADRNGEVLLVGGKHNGDVVGDELEGRRIRGSVVEPLVELGLRLGLRGELDELPRERAVGRPFEHAP